MKETKECINNNEYIKQAGGGKELPLITDIEVLTEEAIEELTCGKEEGEDDE